MVAPQAPFTSVLDDFVSRIELVAAATQCRITSRPTTQARPLCFLSTKGGLERPLLFFHSDST
jgi:hypothetical protein